LVEYPIKVNETANKTSENTRGFLLLNFETNHPEIGNPIKELIGIIKSKLPNSASLKLYKVFIVGIL